MSSSALVRVEDKQLMTVIVIGEFHAFPIICLQLGSRRLGLNGHFFFFFFIDGSLSDRPVVEIDIFTCGSGMRADYYATHPSFLVLAAGS